MNTIFNTYTQITTAGLHKNPIALGQRIYTHFMSDSLYRNSIYLMASTAVMSFFGFFFWMIVARLYTPDEVGIATSIISLSVLISGLASFGLNIGVVRYLPKSNHTNEIINSVYIFTVLISIIITIIYLIGLNIFSPRLLLIQNNIYYSILFILFTLALVLNTMAESVYLAYRSAKYILLKNILLSLIKLILPLILLSLNVYGIFASVGIANIFGFIICVALLMINFSYKPKITFNFAKIKTISIYSFGIYVAGYIGSLPQMVLPLIIVNKIGSSEAGYFYIAMMIANLIFSIPIAVNQSLFSEGSISEHTFRIQISKSFKIIFMLLAPTILFFFFFGRYILQSFGHNYAMEANFLLQVFAISGIFVSLNSVFSTILKIKKMIRELILVGIFSSVIVLSLSIIMLRAELMGIGYAWIMGQFAISLFYLIILRNTKY